ncbi:hypothetical protein C7M84_009964 [Penaeus vannamei]|uniref:Uncharacterized protein n=1 Tax=Penaeus vannamei TaxID=6689 RepID=A0A423T5M3_PENVA|nr:hypothetical protein C7M84_009964 [Penaeus vannamei]
MRDDHFESSCALSWPHSTLSELVGNSLCLLLGSSGDSASTVGSPSPCTRIALSFCATLLTSRASPPSLHSLLCPLRVSALPCSLLLLLLSSSLWPLLSSLLLPLSHSLFLSSNSLRLSPSLPSYALHRARPSLPPSSISLSRSSRSSLPLHGDLTVSLFLRVVPWRTTLLSCLVTFLLVLVSLSLSCDLPWALLLPSLRPLVSPAPYLSSSRSPSPLPLLSRLRSPSPSPSPFSLSSLSPIYLLYLSLIGSSSRSVLSLSLSHSSLSLVCSRATHSHVASLCSLLLLPLPSRRLSFGFLLSCLVATTSVVIPPFLAARQSRPPSLVWCSLLPLSSELGPATLFQCSLLFFYLSLLSHLLSSSSELSSLSLSFSLSLSLTLFSIYLSIIYVKLFLSSLYRPFALSSHPSSSPLSPLLSSSLSLLSLSPLGSLSLDLCSLSFLFSLSLRSLLSSRSSGRLTLGLSSRSSSHFVRSARLSLVLLSFSPSRLSQVSLSPSSARPCSLPLLCRDLPLPGPPLPCFPSLLCVLRPVPAHLPSSLVFGRALFLLPSLPSRRATSAPTLWFPSFRELWSSLSPRSDHLSLILLSLISLLSPLSSVSPHFSHSWGPSSSPSLSLSRLRLSRLPLGVLSSSGSALLGPLPFSSLSLSLGSSLYSFYFLSLSISPSLSSGLSISLLPVGPTTPCVSVLSRRARSLSLGDSPGSRLLSPLSPPPLSLSSPSRPLSFLSLCPPATTLPSLSLSSLSRFSRLSFSSSELLFSGPPPDSRSLSSLSYLRPSTVLSHLTSLHPGGATSGFSSRSRRATNLGLPLLGAARLYLVVWSSLSSALHTDNTPHDHGRNPGGPALTPSSAYAATNTLGLLPLELLSRLLGLLSELVDDLA